MERDRINSGPTLELLISRQANDVMMVMSGTVLAPNGRGPNHDAEP